MQKANFHFDPAGDRIFFGYTKGEDWNGWAVPYLTLESALELVEAMSLFQQAYYDEATDSFHFVIDEDEDPEVYKGVTFEGLGRLYPIGAGSWIWEEVEDAS